jgi:hypothetical protein
MNSEWAWAGKMERVTGQTTSWKHTGASKFVRKQLQTGSLSMLQNPEVSHHFLNF